LFVFISFFTIPPKYDIRIPLIFLDVSLAFVMFALFEFAEPLKAAMIKIINGRSNMVLLAVTSMMKVRQKHMKTHLMLY
jgi:uncharacterized membrane protein YcfT